MSSAPSDAMHDNGGTCAVIEAQNAGEMSAEHESPAMEAPAHQNSPGLQIKSRDLDRRVSSPQLTFSDDAADAVSASAGSKLSLNTASASNTSHGCHHSVPSSPHACFTPPAAQVCPLARRICVFACHAQCSQ